MQLVKTEGDARLLAVEMWDLLSRVGGVIHVDFAKNPDAWFGVSLAINKRDIHATGPGLDFYGPNFTCDKFGEEIIWPNRQYFNKWARKFNNMFSFTGIGILPSPGDDDPYNDGPPDDDRQPDE